MYAIRSYYEFPERVRGLAADDRSVTVQTESGGLYVYAFDKRDKPALLQELSMERYFSSGLQLVQDGNILVDLSPSGGAQIFKRDADGRISLEGNFLQVGTMLSVVEKDGVLYSASTRGVTRITSYNVCYTKLLRF